MSEGAEPENLVRWHELPADIVVHRSVGRVVTENGPYAGAILKTSDETQWYGADWTGQMTDPNPCASAAFWGPFASAAACRPHIIGDVVLLLESDQATDGTSDWFVPYTAPLPAPSGE